jgi:hypothetical protein
MVAAGNHESADNFQSYTQRFRSTEKLAGKDSGSGSNHYYSFDEGLIHFVVINVEVYVSEVGALLFICLCICLWAVIAFCCYCLLLLLLLAGLYLHYNS